MNSHSKYPAPPAGFQAFTVLRLGGSRAVELFSRLYPETHRSESAARAAPGWAGEGFCSVARFPQFLEAGGGSRVGSPRIGRKSEVAEHLPARLQVLGPRKG